MTQKHHLPQMAPFSDTKVPYSRTKDEIEEMLKEAGAVAMRWTETPASMKGTELPILEFVMENQVLGENGEVILSEKVPLRVQAPLTEMRRYDRSRHMIVNMKNRNGSMRLLWWYLWSRLIAAKFGLEDMATTFMGKRILTLPDKKTGRPVSTTFAEAVKERPEIFRGLLPKFTLETDALEYKQERRVLNQAVDVAAEIVEEHSEEEK